MNRWSILFLTLFLPLFIMCTGPDIINILLFSGRNNHEWQKTTPLLQKILEESGKYRVVVSNYPEKLNPEHLSQYDVIVSNWCAWPDVTGERWNKQLENAFLDFIAAGKGFVAFHAASATHQDWPEFQQIVGGTWEKEVTGHGPVHTFKVSIKDVNHPVTSGLNDFYIKDELWHDVKIQPNITILCTAYSSKEKDGTGEDEPVVIFTRYGKGRNFYNILGHNTETMHNKAWQTLILRGIEWAATGEVTIPAQHPWPADSTTAENQSE